MIDHLLCFASEQEAKDQLTDLVIEDQWNTSITIPNIQIILQDAEYTYDFNTGEITQIKPQIVLPGWWIAVALDKINTDYYLLNKKLRLAIDSETNEFVYLAEDIDLAALSTAKVSPIFAGREYRFT